MSILPEELNQFAYIPNWFDKLKQLEAKILPENWKFQNPNTNRKNTQNPILENYLCHTYRRLKAERDSLPSSEKDTKIYINQSHACFNTGLLTPDLEFIYMFFIVNPNAGSQPWKFESYYKESNQRLLRDVPILPKKTEYFLSVNELIFDCSKSIKLFIPHILVNKERLPRTLRDKSASEMHSILYSKLENTRKKIQANYRLAIPTSFEGRMGYFLPLYLEDNNNPSVALAVSDAGTHYEGKTCLTLELAYNDARVIAKPEPCWLEL